MGTLLIQLGQCGNQIGLKLWDNLRASHTSDMDFLFRSGSNIGNSILVDSEPKVVRQVKEDRKMYPHFDPKNVIYHQYGRGNNWAMGYYSQPGDARAKRMESEAKNATILTKIKKSNNKVSFKSGMDKDFQDNQFIYKENNQMLEATTTMIQKEIEKVDCYTGTMFIYSLAGGTGSGFGSRLLENMRDEYASNMLYNTVVFPSRSGETPLQQYNCLLSLAHLQRYSDAVVYFQNDKVYKLLSRASVSVESKMINFDDINDYIASMLHNMFKVNDLKHYNRFYFDLMSDLTSVNECKFVEVFGSPYFLKGKQTYGPEATWENIFDQTFSQTFVDLPKEEEKKTVELDGKSKKSGLNSTIAMHCLMKASDIDVSLQKSETTMKLLEKRVNTAFNPLKWNPDCVNYEFIKEKVKNYQDTKSMLIMANRVHIYQILKDLIDVSESKFKAKAYLHWYYKYGLEEEDFKESFEIIRVIMDNYEFMMA